MTSSCNLTSTYRVRENRTWYNVKPNLYIHLPCSRKLSIAPFSDVRLPLHEVPFSNVKLKLNMAFFRMPCGIIICWDFTTKPLSAEALWTQHNI